MAQSVLQIILKVTKEGTGDREAAAAAKELKGTLKDLGLGSVASASALALVTGAVVGVAKFTHEAIDETVKYAGEVKNLSQITGESAVETSKVIQVMDDFKLTSADLLKAQKELAKDGLNLNIETLAKLSDEYKKLNSGTEKSQFLLDKFGKTGFQFADAMSKGGDALRGMSDEVNKSLILDEKAIQAAEEYRLNVDALNDAWQGVRVTWANDVIPVLNTVLDGLNKQASMTGKSRDEIISYIEGMKQAAESSESATQSYTAMARALQETGAAAETVTEDYKGLLSMTMSLAGASDEATAKIVYNNLLQKASVDGITTAENEMLQATGIALGLFDQKTANSALAIDTLTTAMIDGKLKADDLALAIKNIPEVKNVDLLINLGGNGAAYAQQEAGYTPVSPGSSRKPVPKRDSGGRGMPGQAYEIGIGAQPELFIPDSVGTFVPNGGARGGGSTVNVYLSYAPKVSIHDDADIVDMVYQGINRAKQDGLIR